MTSAVDGSAGGSAGGARYAAAPAAPGSRAERRARTEQAILEAAWALFAEVGYQRTSLRAVARAAGVDPSLVIQYFGGKENLLREAMRPRKEADARIFAGPRAEFGQRLVTWLLGEWSGEHAAADPMIGLLRSSLTEPAAAVMLKGLLERETAEHAFLHADPKDSSNDAELRSQLIVAAVIGLAVTRNVLGLEAIATAEPERLAAVYGQAVQALAGDLTVSAPRESCVPGHPGDREPTAP